MRVQEPWGLAELLLKCWGAVPPLSAAAAWEVDSVTQDTQMGGGLCAHPLQL